MIDAPWLMQTSADSIVEPAISDSKLERRSLRPEPGPKWRYSTLPKRVLLPARGGLEELFLSNRKLIAERGGGLLKY